MAINTKQCLVTQVGSRLHVQETNSIELVYCACMGKTTVEYPYLHLWYAVFGYVGVVEVAADEAVAATRRHTPRPPLPLAERGPRCPHSLQAAVFGGPVTHHLLDQAEVDHYGGGML